MSHLPPDRHPRQIRDTLSDLTPRTVRKGSAGPLCASSAVGNRKADLASPPFDVRNDTSDLLSPSEDVRIGSADRLCPSEDVRRRDLGLQETSERLAR